MTRAKIQEIRNQTPNRHIILAGFNAGAAIALQVALVEQVNSIVCLGFAFNTLFGVRGNPDDRILDLTTPVLFVIGQNAQRSRWVLFMPHQTIYELLCGHFLSEIDLFYSQSRGNRITSWANERADIACGGWFIGRCFAGQTFKSFDGRCIPINDRQYDNGKLSNWHFENELFNDWTLYSTGFVFQIGRNPGVCYKLHITSAWTTKTEVSEWSSESVKTACFANRKWATNQKKTFKWQSKVQRRWPS